MTEPLARQLWSEPNTALTQKREEQINQIGNAVSVAKIKACVGAIMADAAPKKAASVVDSRKAAAA